MGLARTVALVFGAVYVLVGILGFIPGITTEGDVEGMSSATGSLLGIFPVNALHNIVHLAIGAALLYGATTTPAAIMVLKAVGALYILLGVLGLIVPDGFGLVPLGGADVFLHLGTGAILLVVAFMDRPDDTTTVRT